MRRSLLLFYGILFTTFLTFSCEKRPKKLFKLLSPERTGIDFNNRVIENDSMNMLTFTNFYTGAGVGVGDINNDGLQDIFFGSNMESGRLYLNKGDLKFEDITNSAGVETDRWITGVSMVDINQDGNLDIYLSISGPKRDFQNNENMLFINNGDLTFSEQAAAYNLNDSSQTTHGSFFDYDKDGDLDLFSIINPTDYPLNFMGRVTPKKINGEASSTDKLFRNNGDGTFSDVSREAGILIEGYSLGVNTSDFNHDGWVDVFVSNDFSTNDLLYINNGDGTFTNQAKSFFKHTSFASMGNDAGDINNDGLQDLVVVDMYPEDNYREKTLIPGMSYNTFQNMINQGYEPQYGRNVLQVNNGNGTFSEIGQLAGIDKTDWSWSTLFADFDNNGFKDLFVANGFTRDVGNLDFMKFKKLSPFADPDADPADHYKAILDQPGVPLNNYIFKNNGDLTFSKVMEEWGLDTKSFSNGAATADLDNDGDIDLVVNNTNSAAFIYENQSNKLSENHYLSIQLVGNEGNEEANGSKVTLTYADQTQYQEVNPYRGYQSSVDSKLHFGLGEISKIEKLEITWPDGNITSISNPVIDTLLVLKYSNNTLQREETGSEEFPMFSHIAKDLKIDYRHEEDYFIDFSMQPLLPHMHSKMGPSLAVGDINGDGLEDFFVGSSNGRNAHFFIAEANGTFRQSTFPHDKNDEDTGALLHDFDQDGDNDLYVVNGGNRSERGEHLSYQDRLYLNDGKGNFTREVNHLPEINSSGSCVVGADYDKDGDLDLFVGGRFVPGLYPTMPESYLLNNKGGKFTNVSSSVDGLPNIGMVSSALWTDYNNDNWVDLILVGEWMQITLFENQEGRLVNRTPGSGLEKSYGWWNSIVSGDFDKDGDMDYIAGNLGLNTNYEASEVKPLRLYAKDFDKNGVLDPIMSQYYHDGRNYPLPLRDAITEQIPILKQIINTYDDYGKRPLESVFDKDILQDAQVLKAITLKSSYIENLGGGKFEIHDLPIVVQMAPIYGMVVDDFNSDGNPDILAVGNSYAPHVQVGRCDASTGTLLLGDGKGSFKVVRGNQNGLNADKDAKALATISLSGRQAYIVSNNADYLQIVQNVQDQNLKVFTPSPSDIAGIVKLKDGTSYRTEFQYGSGFLSQGSRKFLVNSEIVEVVELLKMK
ncbi:VCBS repeat-containing protein [Jiulongibacter sediminis]|uniref:VCBS repeat-containing protein n=1 Tax=Jiulongibacter sediminis TaxID=1605367 RepID=UPI0026EF4C3C|nr:VCBS repeat-containing protein [Jiulongibacter sediminis]